MIENKKQHLQELLAAITPLEAEEIGENTVIADLGISSLEIQIFAARIEKAFEFRFDDGEIGVLATFGALLQSVERHTSAA